MAADGYFLSESQVRKLKKLIDESAATRLQHLPQEQLGSSPEVYVAWVADTDSIPALTPAYADDYDHPGCQSCDIYQIIPSDSEDYDWDLAPISGLKQLVFNLSPSGIAEGWVLVTRDKSGAWIAIDSNKDQWFYLTTDLNVTTGLASAHPGFWSPSASGGDGALTADTSTTQTVTDNTGQFASAQSGDWVRCTPIGSDNGTVWQIVAFWGEITFVAGEGIVISGDHRTITIAATGLSGVGLVGDNAWIAIGVDAYGNAQASHIGPWLLSDWQVAPTITFVQYGNNYQWHWVWDALSFDTKGHKLLAHRTDIVSDIELFKVASIEVDRRVNPTTGVAEIKTVDAWVPKVGSVSEWVTDTGKNTLRFFSGTLPDALAATDASISGVTLTAIDGGSSPSGTQTVYNPRKCCGASSDPALVCYNQITSHYEFVTPYNFDDLTSYTDQSVITAFQVDGENKRFQVKTRTLRTYTNSKRCDWQGSESSWTTIHTGGPC